LDKDRVRSSTPRGMARWRPMGMDYHGVNAATDDGSKVLGEQGLPRKMRWDGYYYFFSASSTMREVQRTYKLEALLIIIITTTVIIIIILLLLL
jgi:hypothetical protein